jgi:TM2 domain-containing membrane protein YozV
MTSAVCPYCRASVSETDERVICDGCDTPHHRDCYEENGGCTVFGCRCAPADEPKLRVSSPELTRLGTAPPTSEATPARLSYSPLGLAALDTVECALGVATEVRTESPASEQYKSKVTFVMLGVLLGALGVHNFYAGYIKKAVMQLCITVLTLGYAAPMSWIWAIIEICTVERDSNGLQFRS